MEFTKIILKRLRAEFDIDIEYLEKDSVYVKYSDGKAVVSNYTKSYLARSLALLIKGIREGKTEFEITQRPSFENRGIQLELSRNGVMRVDSIKVMLEYIACMGLNSVVLYLEDVYKLKDYPYFGYMRGAYSEEELREIDEYAYELGIEVIPGIQTLGHMEQYLRWPEAMPVRNTEFTLLCGEENTYTLIETMIKTMRRAFRTHKIHIGCDEAHDIALGEYIHKNGYRNGADIMNEHVSRVLEICKKYDFKAIMYSDMYFKLYSKTKNQYDKSVEFPKDISKNIPDVDLVYWDYSHKFDDEYDGMIKKHQELGKNIIFYGGMWSWGELLPRYDYIFTCLIPALKSCIRNSIKDVYAATWGDDGNECSRIYEMFAMTTISEVCFCGDVCSIENITDMSKFLFGIKSEFFNAVSEIAMPYKAYDYVEWGISNSYYGKALFYADIFYNLTGTEEFYKKAGNRYKKASEIIKTSFVHEEWKAYQEHAVGIFGILAIKADVISNIRDAYKNDDREYLEKLNEVLLPELILKYSKLLPRWQSLWLKDYKAFGWEVINGRLGFIIERLKYANTSIEKYLLGEIDRIEELDEVFIENADMAIRPTFKSMVSTSYSL